MDSYRFGIFISADFVSNSKRYSYELKKVIGNDSGYVRLSYENVSFYSRIDNVLLKAGTYRQALKDNYSDAGRETDREDRSTNAGIVCGFGKTGLQRACFERRMRESQAAKFSCRSVLGRDFSGAIDYIKNVRDRKRISFYSNPSELLRLSHLPENDDIEAVICDSCFTSIPEMTKRVLANAFKPFVIFKPGSVLMGRLFFGLDREALSTKFLI